MAFEEPDEVANLRSAEIAYRKFLLQERFKELAIGVPFIVALGTTIVIGIFRVRLARGEDQ